MISLANAREMKAIDSYSIQTLGIPSLVLMERAAYCVARHIDEVLKDRENRTVIAVCGSGNNGGDGLAVVRILYTMGYNVAWYMAGNTDHATQETRLQMDILKRMEIRECKALDELKGAGLIVDALFGIGLTRNVEWDYARTIEAINTAGSLVCAVDMPSGVSTDHGQILGCAVKADFTVTFGVKKLGLVLYPGAALGGRIYVENIGFPAIAEEQAHIHTFALEDKDLPSCLPKRCPYSNKGTYGKVLIIAGSPQMAGACFFSARAAYGCGCGLVRVFTPKENHDVLLTRLPEAVMTLYDHHQVDLGALDRSLSWADAVVIGPGLSCDDMAKKILEHTLKHCRVPLLVDADGLNLLAENPGLWEWVPENTVITPHLGEMSRLTKDPVHHLAEDLPKACREFAEAHKVICVLKDARTVISDGTDSYINLSGNDGMATGGSGDVLSGIIGGFLAQGLPPLQAASLGCFVHGCAGDKGREVKGAYGLLASDIIQYMSKVIK
ncbi:MAG TPA: NAD(P)H-hydrate dehydratase [Candidatus Scybalocola faecavium]|nr:NAD(P)H-hydrate dehydratase [Candidatus Scybalocola faecavium]